MRENRNPCGGEAARGFVLMPSPQFVKQIAGVHTAVAVPPGDLTTHTPAVLTAGGRASRLWSGPIERGGTAAERK